MWTLTWPDETILEAADATAALAALGAEQWRPCDVADMKLRLVDRCFSWAGCYVEPSLEDGAFLRSLAGAGLFRLRVTADA